MSDVENNAFGGLEILQLKSRIKELEFDCAELSKHNQELSERCKKLASRVPEWPKGYRPSRKKFNERKVH